MKMWDLFKEIKKEEVYNYYFRILPYAKEYEKISSKKMVEEIIEFYSDYNNILEICTERELKFLEKLMNNKSNAKELYEFKYFFEHMELCKKSICYVNEDEFEIIIFEEIEDSVKEALKNVDWKKAKKNDEINSILLGFLRINGDASLQSLSVIGGMLLNMPEEEVNDWIHNSKLVNFYAIIEDKYIASIDSYIEMVTYIEHLCCIDNLREERAKQAGAGVGILDAKEYSEIFYTGFSSKKPAVKKLTKKLYELGNIGVLIANEIEKCAFLNSDRQKVFESIDFFANHGFEEVKELIDLIDPALDEMPSGALNGLTPLENEEKKQKNLSTNYEYKQKSVKQENARLSEKDTDLFYKVYFGLLEFVNKKFNVVPKLKIYEGAGIDPTDLAKVIKKLWENPSNLIDEFVKTNPLKFSKEELDIVSNFKKGQDGMFIVAKYEKEYAMFLSMDAAYMVKGLTSNIDEIIPLYSLPVVVFTRLLPFKDYIVYDSIFNEASISMGSGMKNTILKDADRYKKIYKL